MKFNTLSIAVGDPQALIIFIKNPLIGKVKTRLAKTVGDHRALEIYHELLEHTLQSVISIRSTDKFLYYSNHIDHDDRWENSLFLKRLQTSGHLGTRIIDAFHDVFKTHKRAVIIGSDCGEITSALLIRAFQKLENADLVIGPSFDGGYYLLGVNALYPTLFQEIPWSTHEVYSKTIHTADQLKLRTEILPTLHDVDTWEDWVRLGWE